MVRLDRLTLQGFKSFAVRTTIPFPEGFNIIAGPNGSGKSNICDAVMFVLGVSSARAIRAQKLQNLIFNGSQNRQAADMCEASLYFDNSDGKIPGEKELKLTRKVSRSGISVYKLNGKTVTRTKIQELLSYAGLSPEGYNIIMQGDVTNIIEISPVGRREIIDDISGITEFSEKKEKAVKELEKVEFRVRESMIVVAEKERLVSRLKSEKESAEKYQKLSSELMKLKASLNRKKLSDSQSKMDVLEKEINEGVKKFGILDREFSGAEKALEEKEKSSQKRVDEIIKKSRNYDILRKIDSMQSDMLRKRDKIDLNERESARLKSFTSQNPAVKAVLDSGMPGIRGTVGSLVKIPNKYVIALEVAIGRHADDIVVDYEETAAECIKFLKEKRIGRARFLPLESVKSLERKEYRGGEKIIGYAIDLIEFGKEYYPAINYVLGSTLVAENIDTARRIKGFRVSTLDGDLVETSRVMIGGYYASEKKNFYEELKKIDDENSRLLHEIGVMEKELEKLKGLQEEETEEVKKLQEAKGEEEKEIESLRSSRKKLYEERIILQNDISRLKVEKAKLEASLDNLRLESENFRDVKEFYGISEDEMAERIRKTLVEINGLGPINMKALDEYKSINVEFEEMKKRLDKLLEEKESVLRVVQEVEKRRYDKFMGTLSEINRHFSRIYKDLTNGFGNLRLEEENAIESGLVIEASPEGKKILNIDSMSGGEKTLTSLSFLFAIMQHYASPFYILDEVDAALDKANTKKIVELVKKYSKDTQFIVITHNDFTIQEADKVFGVSMEDGISKVFGIEMPKERA